MWRGVEFDGYIEGSSSMLFYGLPTEFCVLILCFQNFKKINLLVIIFPEYVTLIYTKPLSWELDGALSVAGPIT